MAFNHAKKDEKTCYPFMFTAESSRQALNACDGQI